MRLTELEAGGFCPVVGTYAFTATVANGAITALTFTTPIPAGKQHAEAFLNAVARALAIGANKVRVAATNPPDGTIFELNGVAQAATFDPTAYTLPTVTNPVDLTADIGNVSLAYSEEGGTVTIGALTLVVDPDGLVLESVPKLERQ